MQIKIVCKLKSKGLFMNVNGGRHTSSSTWFTCKNVYFIVIW